MEAGVLNDDSRCSTWFEEEQELHQGCVLSPRLFNIFFATILLVTPERFSEDVDILVDFAHLQRQPSKVGPEIALECVRRTI